MAGKIKNTDNYSVSLDIKAVEEAKMRVGPYGKLSPVLNKLLTAWVLDMETMERVSNKIIKSKEVEEK